MINTTLDQSLLDQPVVGVNLTAETFSEALGDSKTLLIFLRHFG